MSRIDNCTCGCAEDGRARVAESDSRPWLQTKSGRAFPLVDPEPSDIYWPDIIYALAHINRFGGHVGEYSVAQHSMLVADQLRPEWRLYGLLHDAHEAFIGDVPTPLKKRLKGMGVQLWTIADAIDRAILEAADLRYPVPEEIAEAVHIADTRALVTERRDLMRKPPKSWGAEYESVRPLPERIEYLRPYKVIARFTLDLAGAGLTIAPISFTG